MSAQSDSLQSGTLKSHLWFTRVGNWSCHVETKHLWWIGLLRLISSAGSLLLSTGLLAKPAGASECLRWPLVRDHWLVYCCQKPTARKKKEHSYSWNKCQAFSMLSTITLLYEPFTLHLPCENMPSEARNRSLICQITNVSGAGLLVVEACNICPFMPSLVLCRCILNYSLCWRITALFIKGGDNFFWIALQSGRVLSASQDCFQQFMHAAYAKCSARI